MKWKKVMAELLVCGCGAVCIPMAAGARSIGVEQPDGSLKIYQIVGEERIGETVENDRFCETEVQARETQRGEAGVGADAAQPKEADAGAADAAQRRRKEAAAEEAQRQAGRFRLKEELAYLETYGVIYDVEADETRYHGKKVRCIVDCEELFGTETCTYMSEGTVDIYTVRKENGALTGVREASQEEFDEKTKELALMEEGSGQYVTMTSEDAFDSSVVWDSDAAYFVEGKEDEYSVSAGDIVTEAEAGYSVALEGAVPKVEAGYSVSLEGVASEDDASVTWKWEGEEGDQGLEVSKEDVIASEATCIAQAYDGSDPVSRKIREEEEARKAEYEKNGITQSGQGGWLWNGRRVYMLLDEDGSISMCNTDEVRKERLYLYISRDEDGQIDEVSVIDGKELLEKKAELDLR